MGSPRSWCGRAPARSRTPERRARRAVTDDTALRLAAAFGTSPEIWMNLQKSWELETARDAAGGVDWAAMRVG